MVMGADGLGGAEVKDFSLEGFAAHLVGLSLGGEVLTDNMLEYTGKTVEKAAKDKFGEYQDEAGPFAEWAPLAESTKQDRIAKGFPEDEPLLRTGDTRDSIGHRVGFQEVEIGSDSEILEYLEFGTEKMPARSTLGGAAFEQAPKIVERLGVEMTAFLSGTNDRKIKIEGE
jgi:hypothetical protein